MGCLAGIIFFVAIDVAQGATLNISDPVLVASQQPAAPHFEAGSRAHIFENAITLSNAAFFPAAFNAWNDEQPADAKWTLVDGGPLADLTINVTRFEAFSQHRDQHAINPGIGGVEIQISIDYEGADAGMLLWTQGLYTNYLLDGSIVPAFYEMDVSAGSHGFPIYPHQNPLKNFSDGPAAPFDNGFFEADAFLCKINSTTRTLTLHDGVEYGFYLYVIDVPEPATWKLLLAAVAVVALAKVPRGRLPDNRWRPVTS
jgi:hypothetical protein